MARRARVDVSVDGVTFTRSQAQAARRGAALRTHLDWDDVDGVEVQTTRKGRVVIRVTVVDQSAATHHRADPYAIKVPRKQSEAAYQLVQQIEEEVVARRRWRQLARP